ncbi:uncharacterized protein AAEQ78_003496 isoform 1-T1 [Lycaon pictus]
MEVGGISLLLKQPSLGSRVLQAIPLPTAPGPERPGGPRVFLETWRFTRGPSRPQQSTRRYCCYSRRLKCCFLKLENAQPEGTPSEPRPRRLSSAGRICVCLLPIGYGQDCRGGTRTLSGFEDESCFGLNSPKKRQCGRETRNLEEDPNFSKGM